VRIDAVDWMARKSGLLSRAALVPTRKTLPRSAFLHRCHPVGAGDRFGRCQAHLADISADGFARNGRLGAIGAMGIRHDWARAAGEKQHQQYDLHQAFPVYGFAALSKEWG
jgi:hypothetical protein